MVPQKRILVVEDNAINRAMLYEILSDEYGVLEAENGQEALDILRQRRDMISLILLDVMMPVMDGYTFLDKVKEEPELALIPVIVMTQGSSEEDEVAALAHGATDFVPKPYRPKVILHRVASLIKLRETAAMVNQFQYDRLTGLYSKEFFYRKVRDRLDANPDVEYTIACSNIENFKLFNDAFGRKAGDRLLVADASELMDKAGEDGICGRYGADRFLCLMPRSAEGEDRSAYYRSLLSGQPDKLASLTIKWGIYEVTDRSITVEQMCDRALLAVDSIKGQYNEVCAVYDDTLRSKLLREKAITDTMEAALAQEQFTVYLQPKYSLSNARMAGAEALVRWIHPEWGFMSPGEFIPLFERNGFIHRLDQYVWERACIQLRDWKRKGLPLIPISVNVSRADVYQTHLVDILVELTKKYDVEPAYLHLEITESAYAENPAQIISTVGQLRKLGFPIEMDDFGSGYSSLNMLGQMQLDILKLDMKFVQNEIAKPADRSMLNDIIVMAHRMQLRVVAEGVETSEQVRRLRSLGCDYVQGYYFAKPMPVDAFEALYRENLSAAASQETADFREEVSKKLLVVDDDAAYREKVCQLFEGEYEIACAADAPGAVTCLREQGDVSVVILSVTIPGNGAAELLRTMRQDPALWQVPVLAAVPSGAMMEKYPLAMDTDDFLCKCHPLADLRRRIERLMDTVESRRREIVLQDEASRDFLTGLLNRRGLQTAMESLQKEDLPLAVCMFDLDGLKTTNDTSGHDAGDQMIQGFADLLRRQTRVGDILCRYGGDEFVVILKHMGSSESAAKKGEGICRIFQAGLLRGGISSGCSAGVAMCGADEKPSVSLIEHADIAMYRAKRENKGGCCLWTGEE